MGNITDGSRPALMTVVLVLRKIIVYRIGAQGPVGIRGARGVANRAIAAADGSVRGVTLAFGIHTGM